jgi:hypothetical protein
MTCIPQKSSPSCWSSSAPSGCTHTADIGALRVSVPDKEYVYVPAWVGLGTLLVGVLLLAVPRKA